MSSASQDIRLCDRCNHTFSRLLRPRASTTLTQLRTHHIPSSSERENMSRLLSEVEADLESYDEEINRLAAVLLELRGQRAAVQKYADDFRCLQAPIRRLPVEVLGEIFAQGIPQWPGENPETRPDGTNAVGFKMPLTLGVVCKKWRDIVLSSKELSSTIIVDLNAYDRETDAAGSARLLAVKGILSVYLQRSGNAPLSISLLRGFQSGGSSKAFRRAFKSIYNALAQQSHRWRRARVMINAVDALGVGFWDAIEGRLPDLEELQIQDVDDISTAFSLTPKLHTVTLFNYNGDYYGGAQLPIQWGQIQTLLFNGQYFDFTAAAEECPQLNRLEINTASLRRIQLIDYLRCDSLEHLSLHAERWDGDGELDDDEPDINALADFFGLLTLPSLKSLTIGLPPTYTEPIDYTQNVWPFQAYTSFLSQSSCSLHTLCFENIRMTEAELLDVLNITPTLTALKIHEIPVQGDEPCPIITNALLSIMTHRPNHTSTLPVPRLTHLELKAAPFFDDQFLLRMIESRRPPQSLHSHGPGGNVACLEYVAVSYMNREMEPTCLSRLRELGKEGLKIMLDPVVHDVPPSFSPGS